MGAKGSNNRKFSKDVGHVLKTMPQAAGKKPRLQFSLVGANYTRIYAIIKLQGAGDRQLPDQDTSVRRCAWSFPLWFFFDCLVFWAVVPGVRCTILINLTLAVAQII